jgi:CO/xanthine dehydrogenase Mo-binding subunit
MTSDTNKQGLKVVGTRPIRPDGVEKVTGRANFGADRALPGMLHAKIKRSPHAHARVVRINAQGAGPAFATHVCDVEVDPETGHVKVLRYTATQDVGRAIHPSYVEGQIQGGVAQGIGWALKPAASFGVRGVGEVPIVPPMAAVANAIHAATGMRLRDLPMSPPKILAEIDAEEPRRLAAE